MIIDNFEKIKPILKWDTNDDFYHVMIMQRPKETGVQRVVKQFIIREGDLDKLHDRIIEYCKSYTARAYINPNRKSFKNATLTTIQNLTTCVIKEDYSGVQDKFFSACGQIGTNYKKIFVIDIDCKDEALVSEVHDYVNTLMPNPGEDKIILRVDTKNGVHLLSSPFNPDELKNKYNIDVHKNNFTLLYFEYEDLNELLKNGQKLELIGIIRKRCENEFGLKETKSLIDYYEECNLDLNGLFNKAAIETAIDEMWKYFESKISK